MKLPTSRHYQWNPPTTHFIGSTRAASDQSLSTTPKQLEFYPLSVTLLALSRVATSGTPIDLTFPQRSLVLSATKEHYFTRLSAEIRPSKPGFEDMRWIMSGGVDVEHLLDVFTTVNENSTDIWIARAHPTRHLYQHKERPISLMPKTEQLPDDHPSKRQRSVPPASSLGSVGSIAEKKWLPTNTLKHPRVRRMVFTSSGC